MLFLSASLSSAPAEAAHFSCSGGDVPCLVTAIHQANANGQENTITLTAGAYTLSAVDNSTDAPTGLPVVTSTLSITGAGADVTKIERAADAPAFRIFNVGSTGVLTLEKVTVQGGTTEPTLASGTASSGGSGGGIFAAGTVKITDSVVTANIAGLANGGQYLRPGGGIAGGNVIVTRTTISANRADAGAGIYILPNGTLTVKDSVITQNGAGGGGGGIWFPSHGTLTVADSVISGNSSNVFGPIVGGSGIAVGDACVTVPCPVGAATVTITDSTISNNSLGGGIEIFAGNTVHISRSSIVGNSSFRGPGSGIELSMLATLTIDDSTIGNNMALDQPSDLSLGGTTTVRNSTIVGSDGGNFTGNISNTGSTTVENTILSSVSFGSRDCEPKIKSLGHNLMNGPILDCVDRVSSDLAGAPGLGDFVDPGRPGAGHFPLLASSRAIDVGDNEACDKSDQLRLVRPIDGNGDGVRTCDIGSTEFYPTVNDLVQLDALSSRFIQPSSTRTDPLTAGGEFRVAAVFTNIAGLEICHVAFAVTTLHGDAGAPPVLVTTAGESIGREGIVVPAQLAEADSDLEANQRERYTFRIGVPETEPITFLVNVLGEATAGACDK